MKRKPLFYGTLVLGFLLLSSVLLYSYPVFLGLNPFYTGEDVSYGENSIKKDYVREDLISQVRADLPDGWKIKTESYSGNFLIENNKEISSQEMKGLTNISVYNGDKLISTIYALVDYGGDGNYITVFPDSDPEVIKNMQESFKDVYDYTVVEYKEGEYSELDLFGLEVRRVGNGFFQNMNKTDDGYFAAPLNDLIYFPEEGPSYKVYNSGELTTKADIKYVIQIDSEATEDEVKTLDTIFNSMELR
jgi:hypothetical protein